MADAEKEPTKHKTTGRQKFNTIALWTAVLTALGSTGIPRIVELLENKPSVEKVQELIAAQTEALTKELNRLVDATKDLGDKLVALKSELAVQKGRNEVQETVIQTCCTKQATPQVAAAVKALPEPAAVAPIPEPKPPKSVRDLQRVPDFSAQKTAE